MDVRDENDWLETGGTIFPFPEFGEFDSDSKEDPFKTKSNPCCGFKESETTAKDSRHVESWRCERKGTEKPEEVRLLMRLCVVA